MGAREAFASLGVAPVAPAKSAGATPKPLAGVGGSTSYPSCTGKVREPDGEPFSQDDRRAWGDQLSRDLHGWLSVHPRYVWRQARIWEAISAPLERLEGLVLDYEMTGEAGDRRAAVFAANGVAAVAARAAREWEQRFNTAGH